MVNHKFLITFLISSIGLVSGCSDNGILFRSVGSYDVIESKGIYLIEKPYQLNGKTYTPKEDYNYFDSGDAFWFAHDKNKPFTANGERNNPQRFTAIHRTLPLPSIIRITNLNNGMSVLARVNDRGPTDSSRLIDVSQSVAEYLNFSKTTVTPVQVEVMVAESRALKEQLEKENNIPKKFTHEYETKKMSSTQGEVILNADEILYPGMSNQNIQQLKIDKNSIKQPEKNSKKQIDEQKNVTFSDNDIIYSGQITEKISAPMYIQVGAFSQQSSVNKIRKNLKGFNNLFVQNRTKNDIMLHHVRLGPFSTQNDAQKTLDKIHRSGYLEAKIIQE